MCKSIMKPLLILLFSVVIAMPVTAAEITNALVYAFRDNEGASPVFTGQGDNFSFGVADVVPDSTNGTVVSAYNQFTGDTFSSLPVYPEQGRPGLFGYENTFADAQSRGWLTTWELTITNDTNIAKRYTPDRTGIEKMEFVKNLSISGPATAPTVTWELPNTGPAVNGVRYELWNNDTNQVLSGANSVPIGTGAVSLSLSGLQMGTNYAIRIIPEQRISGAPASRSSNWLGWEAKIGEAHGTVLDLTAGLPAGAMQAVNTPDETFGVEFDYKFTTDTGTLSVFLDDQLIGTQLIASESTGEEFLHALFEVEDESLLGLAAASLLFQLDGLTGSNVLIDNIVFPNLLNGDFEEGLNLWTPQGEGTVSTSAVPVPAAAWLLGAGIIGLIGIRRKMRQ